MAKCSSCGEEFYVWDEDKNTPFQLFCCEKCIEDHNKRVEEEDWPRDPAIKYNVPVGEIACPRCGTVQHGVLNPICPYCDKLYWKEEECNEDNNPYVYDSGDPNEKDRD